MQTLLLISAFTGAALILTSLILLCTRRITLERISNNPNLKEEAIKAEIFKVLKISSSVPTIALFIIGLLLIVIPIYAYPERETSYIVKGTVKKADDAYAGDISIHSRFPPLSPSTRGEIADLKVWKGPDGKFPWLFFAHPDYGIESVDLNDKSQVDIRQETISIKQAVELLRIPRKE